jgi:hypothetical protein
MQTQDCMALTRFKKQSAVLSRGRAAKKTFHFTWEPLKHARLTAKQYQTCLNKLHKTGVTPDELALFNTVNEYDRFPI